MFAWYHWLAVAAPACAVCALAFSCRRYVRSVSDFLVAGRCAGRYVLLSGSMMGSLSVITLVAGVETGYTSGWAYSFWNDLLMPLSAMLSLYGWIYYRFRETRAMSAGQFFEMRYGKGLRRLAAVMRGTADLLGNCIGPAVAVRFFIYLLGIPHAFSVFGVRLRTFPVLLAACLALALAVILAGGRISLLVTDAVQGLVSYPVFVAVVAYVLCRFSWQGEIAPVMADRVPGESFLDPYDISRLRDFNLFVLVVACYRMVVGGEWVGNGYATVAKSAHEGKMSALLSSVGFGLAFFMPFVLTCAVLCTMNHAHYAPEARVIRAELCARVAEELVEDPAVQAAVAEAAAALPERRHVIGADPPLSRAANLDTPTLDAVRGALSSGMDGASANRLYQGFRTTYLQQMLPVAMRTVFPRWLSALLVALCVLLVLSTDDTRIFDIATTWTQDFILPFFKRAPPPRLHLAVFKCVVVAVGCCFWLGSCLFEQLDYINMFVTIACSMWFTGAGAVVTLGLYWRRGTAAGAYAALLSAAAISLCGVFVQRGWAATVLPWLAAHGLDGAVRHALEAASAPFDPWIRWTVSDAEWAVKFPVNSVELSFFAMLVALLLYVAVSLLTCRRPFDLDRMLHRNAGPAAAPRNGGAAAAPRPGAAHFARRLVGITPEYTRADRAVAWFVFAKSVVYGFFGAFVAVAVCAKAFHWGTRQWAAKFFVTGVAVPVALGLLTSVWFSWGTARDLRRLFRDLETRVRDDRDNGMVEKDAPKAPRPAAGRGA